MQPNTLYAEWSNCPSWESRIEGLQNPSSKNGVQDSKNQIALKRPQNTLVLLFT